MPPLHPTQNVTTTPPGIDPAQTQATVIQNTFQKHDNIASNTDTLCPFALFVTACIGAIGYAFWRIERKKRLTLSRP